MKKSLKKKLSLNKQTLAAIDRESGKYVLGGANNPPVTIVQPPVVDPSNWIYACDTNATCAETYCATCWTVCTCGGTCGSNCYSNCNSNCPQSCGC